MRKKPNLLSRMERCARVLLEEPETLRGRWLEANPGYNSLALELGCGKGRFTADYAARRPQALVAAVERAPDALVVAMERACALNLTNVRFLCRDAKLLPQIFAPGEVDTLFLNFCDPWPRNRDRDRRLTAPGFLELYAAILAKDGELRFKTDNRPLFDWSLLQLKKCGWDPRELTYDLHANGIQGIMTDYEAKFHEQGVPICQVIAVLK